MKIAIISDIHSNLEALNAAFNLIKDNKIDEIICLGDIIGYGADPNDCIEFVRKVTPYIILGNHDEAAVDPSQTKYFNVYARFAANWTSKILSADNKNFIQNLPLSLERHGLLFVHSSPYQPENWHYIISVDQAKFNMSKFDQPVCFIGHSHVSTIFDDTGHKNDIEKGKKFLINVGSVGQPRDGDPRLSFGIFDTDTWQYSNIRLQYDVKKAADKIIKAGLPKALAQRLHVGR